MNLGDLESVMTESESATTFVECTSEMPSVFCGLLCERVNRLLKTKF